MERSGHRRPTLLCSSLFPRGPGKSVAAAFNVDVDLDLVITASQEWLAFVQSRLHIIEEGDEILRLQSPHFDVGPGRQSRKSGKWVCWGLTVMGV
jgi:hypothetical protein